MKISGYDFLIEIGRWVDVDRLYSPAFYSRFLEEMARLVQNPDSPIYRQYSPLNKIRRIRMTNERVYARVNTTLNRVAILAVAGRGEIKRDEMSGALDIDFTDYLLSHVEFRPDRFVPLLSLEEYKNPIKALEEEIDYFVPNPTVEPEPSFTWGPTITNQALSEQEAAAILLGDKVVRPMDQISASLMAQVERAFPGDKIMVPLPPGSDNWEKWMIRSLQTSIKHRLALKGKNYSVRYDDISRKFILIPPDKIEVYALNRIGRLSKIHETVEAQDARQ